MVKGGFSEWTIKFKNVVVEQLALQPIGNYQSKTKKF